MPSTHRASDPIPTPTPTPAPDQVPARGTLRQRLGLLALLLAGFLDILDANIVNVALPSIQRDIGATYTALQWVVVGYALPFALGLITGGRLGDIYGRKRVFLTGIAGFMAASAVCGLATGPGILIGGRVLQGLAAALMVPQILASIRVTVPPAHRGAAYAAYGALNSLAHVSALLIGGALVSADVLGLSWRPIFLINLPVGALALATAAALLPESRSERPLRLDLVGMLLVSVALLGLLAPLMQGRELGWPAGGFAVMLAAAGVLAAFAAWERHAQHRHGAPIVAPGLFRQRGFVAGGLVLLTFFGAVGGLLLTLTLYLQQGLGYSPLRAGVASLPFPVGVAAAAVVATRLAPRWGRRVITAGAGGMALGVAGLLLTVTAAGAVEPWHLTPALLTNGLGMGLVVGPAINLTQAGVPAHDAGAASGVLNASIQFGVALGVTALGTLFVTQLGDSASTLTDPARAAAFTSALQPTLACTLAAAAAVAWLTLLLPRTARS